MHTVPCLPSTVCTPCLHMHQPNRNPSTPPTSDCSRMLRLHIPPRLPELAVLPNSPVASPQLHVNPEHTLPALLPTHVLCPVPPRAGHMRRPQPHHTTCARLWPGAPPCPVQFACSCSLAARESVSTLPAPAPPQSHRTACA
ncbi:hypothetical protein B0H10DRAFT_2221120 [Mycena sp. CBHHK59/15]|nr:hypothetical protein B0H10DRAFT_2221120 [Mycena sp. CBHHK59/15]